MLGSYFGGGDTTVPSTCAGTRSSSRSRLASAQYTAGKGFHRPRRNSRVSRVSTRSSWRNPLPSGMGRSHPSVDLLTKSSYTGSMKLTLRVQLVPDAAGDDALRRTTERFNEAANWTAGVLFEH